MNKLKKLIKALNGLLEDEFCDDFDEIVMSVVYELERRAVYTPVIPGQQFWYVNFDKYSSFEPSIIELNCIDIKYSKKYKGIVLVTSENIDVPVSYFDNGIACKYKATSERIYRKQFKLWRDKNESY